MPTDLIPVDLTENYNIGSIFLKGVKNCEKPVRIYVEKQEDADHIIRVSQDPNLYFTIEGTYGTNPE